MVLLKIIKNLLPLRVTRWVRRCTTVTIFDILDPSLKRIGILNYENDELSGEAFLLRSILPSLIKAPAPILFDVGANVGDYTSNLLKAFPTAKVHAFEPSPEAYLKLIGKVSPERVCFVAKGLSDSVGIADFFDYGDIPGSAHASLYNDVIKVLHHSSNIKSFQVHLTTLDHYCETEELALIDFIKIDTEGNELATLKGAKQLIAKGGLPIIQFEFNEMNIISRSFLKDFYDILEGYSFFRLMPTGLLPLGPYNSRNEIFVFQNIFAVRSELFPAYIMNRFLVPPLK